MSVKVHFAVDHIEDFAPNCGAYSDEQGERVHQLIKQVQKNFKGKNPLSMLSEFHWSNLGEGTALGRKNRKNLFM